MKDPIYIEKIKSFFLSKKRMPSFEELRKLLGFSSKNAVSRLIDRLTEKNILARDKRGKLIPLSLNTDLKVLGIVEAGFATEAEEESLDTLSLDDFLIQNKEATYMLTVKGESMKDAGILPGDMVLAERGKIAKAGDIVIALVDRGFTLKYLRGKVGSYYLEPANKSFKPIFPKESLKIEAVVKVVIRKLD